MATLDEVNRLVETGVYEFDTLFDGVRLWVRGSHDLSFGRHVRLVFHGVRRTTCPEWMAWPVFWLVRSGDAAQPATFGIRDDDGIYEVIADRVDIDLRWVRSSEERAPEA